MDAKQRQGKECMGGAANRAVEFGGCLRHIHELGDAPDLEFEEVEVAQVKHNVG